MNIIFTILFLLGSIFFCIQSPDAFLSTLLDGGSKAAATCVALIANYTVWLGLMRVWEDSGVTRGVSRLLKPLTKRLFKTDDEETLSAISVNLSSNLFGLAGAATPYGVKAANLLDKSQNAEYSSAMLFVINATGIQLIPTSIIGVRTALKSAAPADILFPSLVTTLFSTLLGIALVSFFFRKRNFSPQPHIAAIKRQGAGTR